MKLFYSLLMLSILLSGCRSSFQCLSADEAKNETLFHAQSKNPSHGSFHFLKWENGIYKEIVFVYSLNGWKNTRLYCTKFEEREYCVPEKEDSQWLNAEMVRQLAASCHSASFGKVFYKKFSENFLDLSNDEKIKVLESLSGRDVEK